MSTKNNQGITVFAVVVFLGIIFIFTTGLLAYLMNSRLVTKKIYDETRALNIAEAGVDKALWCLNNVLSQACGSGDYTGETASFGGGEYTTNLVNTGTEYLVTATGEIDGVEKTIKTTITQASALADASFFYGVQVGAGGLTMKNGSHVDGNVYSNGTIAAETGAYITGDVYVAGGTALTASPELATSTSTISFGNTESTEDITQSFQATETNVVNYISLNLAKIGAPSNATVFLTANNSGFPSQTPLATGTLYADQVVSNFGWVDVYFDQNPELHIGQTYWIVVDVSSPKTNRYFLSALHTNNGYGNGTGYIGQYAADSWSAFSPNPGDINFKIWMGGIENYIDGLIVGYEAPCDYETHHGDAHAQSILNSTVECNVYYDSDITNTTYGGQAFPGEENPPPAGMPISEGQILEWKSAAEEVEVHNGDLIYNINGQSTSLGPIKINGNFEVSNGFHLTITGTIWVTGNVLFSNNAIIDLDPLYGADSGLIIADGTVDVNNNCIFDGSGQAGSYIMIMSTNSSVSEILPAININNNADTVIFYATQGLLNVANNAALKEATAYKMSLANNSSVIYETGLASASFSQGPGGIWILKTNSWTEIN